MIYSAKTIAPPGRTALDVKDPYRRLLREYELLALRCLEGREPEGATAREVWEQVNQRLEATNPFPRTVILSLLERLSEAGVISRRDEPCPEGKLRRYFIEATGGSPEEEGSDP